MTRRRHRLVVRAGGFFIILLAGAPGDAATLQPKTVQAWEAYVAATEARIERELNSGEGFLAQDFIGDAKDTRRRVRLGDIEVGEMASSEKSGEAIAVPGGMIHHWRGSVFVPGVALDDLLRRLKRPSERGPHQEDVLALRVLRRDEDSMSLFIRMTRKKIVTVTYNTEHAITYRRHGPSRASSRSVATKIAELDTVGTDVEREKLPGEDRGFLWRLNSYWRYEEVDGGVIVELESLTLSRDVPFGLRVVVEPLIDRVARESMGRTLANLRSSHTPRAAAAATLEGL